jgi:phage gp36-like protein
MAGYTTPEAVMSRLEGRLAFLSTPVLGGQTVNAELIDRLIEQSEAWLDSHLIQLYQLPLSGTYPLLAEYVEQAVVCQLYSIYYQGKDVNDDRGGSFYPCDRASQILKALASGAIALSGEVHSMPDFSSEYTASTIVGQRASNGEAEGIQW